MEHQGRRPAARSMDMDAAAAAARRLQSAGSDELGQSCRVYCPATGRVPFEWEDEPGKPKTPAWTDVVPPLCPSPAMQSARLSDRRGTGRRKSGGAAGGGFEGCIPLRFHLARAMKRWV